MSDPAKPPRHQLPPDLLALSALLAACLSQGRFAQGLAYAWLVLSHKDADRFKDWSITAATGERQLRQGRQDALRNVDHGDESALARAVEAALRVDPPLLIEHLDFLLLNAAGQQFRTEGADGFPEDIYERHVLRVVLSREALQECGVASTFDTMYLVRRNTAAPKSPVQRQPVDPDRFNPNWYLFSRVPDPSQPARVAEGMPPSIGFERACARIAARPSSALKIYLAEFATALAFDAELSPDHGGARLWTAHGLLNYEVIAQEAIAHLANAKTAGADVVMFPELTGPEPVRLCIADWLDRENEAFEREAHTIGWVLAGSFHEKDAAALPARGPQNVAFALDGRGNAIPELAHVKLTSVALDLANIIEGNDRGKRVQLIGTPIGIQALIICLDLCQDARSDRLPLEHLPLDWLWVPSMIDKVAPHLTRSASIARQRLMHIACANQATALCAKGVELKGAAGQSFLFGPSGRSSSALEPELSPPSSKLFTISLATRTA